VDRPGKREPDGDSLLGWLGQAAVGARAAGGSADEVAQQPIPSPFDAWSHGMGLFGANMRYLHQRLSGEWSPGQREEA
jgi:hypothetical protein